MKHPINTQLTITSDINPQDWMEIARLIASGIPNYIISRIHPHAGAVFYQHISEQPDACCFIAIDQKRQIMGVIIGAKDYAVIHSYVFRKYLPQILIAANLSLFSKSVFNWVLNGIKAKFERSKKHIIHPTAELSVIAIRPEAYGTGLAQELIRKMEICFLNKGIAGPYSILTEKTNVRSNHFYKKTGATLLGDYKHHGREINVWQKEITSA